MGFLFSSDPVNRKFDGLLVKSTAYSTASNWQVIYTSSDLWTTSRPFKDGKLSGLEGIEKDSANDWNITAEKSSLSCPGNGGRCTIKAHWNRKFETDDNKDIQMEAGNPKGYEIIPFYRIFKAANPDALPLRENLSIENYILMGAASNLSTAFAAMVSLYMACNF